MTDSSREGVELPAGILDLVSIGGLNACWWWRGSTHGGYGSVRLNGKSVRAHRLFYEHLHGPIAEGHQLHHTCKEKTCVNPRHLLMVTPKDHVVEHVNERTHCGYGHEWTPENTWICPSSGTRECRACKRRLSTERNRRLGHKPMVVYECPSRAAYNRGCRCDGCKAASAAYARERFRKQKLTPQAGEGDR